MLVYGVREQAPAFIAAACRRILQRYDNHIMLHSSAACSANGSFVINAVASSRDKSGGKPPHSIKQITQHFPYSKFLIS